MAFITLDGQTVPAGPGVGKIRTYQDSSNKQWYQRNENGLIGDWSAARATQIASHSADTYYLGLQLPSHGMQASMAFMWEWVATKGAAGAATPIYQLRIGAAGTTADTSRLSITGPAQTAAADVAFFKALYTVRTVGAAGVIQGLVWVQHNLAATGFANTPAGFSLVQATSAGFDNQNVGGQFVGLSVNPGASGAWVVDQVFARAWY